MRTNRYKRSKNSSKVEIYLYICSFKDHSVGSSKILLASRTLSEPGKCYAEKRMGLDIAQFHIGSEISWQVKDWTPPRLLTDVTAVILSDLI